MDNSPLIVAILITVFIGLLVGYIYGRIAEARHQKKMRAKYK